MHQRVFHFVLSVCRIWLCPMIYNSPPVPQVQWPLGTFFSLENVSQNLSSYKSQFTNIVNMMDIKITVKLVGLSLLKYTCPMRLN